MTNPLRDLFHQPAEHPIGPCTFRVHKLQFDQFDDALVVARHLDTLDLATFDVTQLEALTAGSAVRLALNRMLAGCLTLLKEPGEPIQLQPADVDVMPALMVGEALAVVMEVNADFFFQTLPKLLQTALRIRSTGLALLNRLSAQATAPTE